MAGERAPRRLPPLLASRPRGAQVALAVGGPIVFGAVCGVALGLSGVLYLVLSLLAAAGAVAAGFEHAGPGGGLLRGVVGGLLFGTALLVAHSVQGGRPMAKLPEPEIVLVGVTTVVGAVLSALGGAVRARLARPA